MFQRENSFLSAKGSSLTFLPTGRARRARLFKNVRSPIPMQGLVIDEPTISRARTTESCFWLRLPAICMTFDPSPTRVLDLSAPLSLSLFLFLHHPSSLRLSFPPPFLTRLESPVQPPDFDGSIYFCNSPYLSNSLPDHTRSIRVPRLVPLSPFIIRIKSPSMTRGRPRASPIRGLANRTRSTRERERERGRGRRGEREHARERIASLGAAAPVGRLAAASAAISTRCDRSRGGCVGLPSDGQVHRSCIALRRKLLFACTRHVKL